MNIHHLELFYYVAKHEGITKAIRHLPYGIQQPALSSQLIALEDELGTKLFQRRPFALTPAGAELYAFITPFFGNLRAVGDKISGYETPRLRLASTPTVIRDYFPFFLAQVRESFPNLKLSVREIDPLQTEDLLRRQEVDIVVAFSDQKPPTGLTYLSLAKLSLELIVPAASRYRSAMQAIREGIEQQVNLISLPANTAPQRVFQKGLKQLELGWLPEIEVNSLELIHTYVTAGFGLGLSVNIPNAVLPNTVQALPLRRFPKLEAGLFWQGKLNPAATLFAEQVRQHVDKLLLPAPQR